MHHHEGWAPDATVFCFSHARFQACLRPQTTLDQPRMRLQVAPIFRASFFLHQPDVLIEWHGLAMEPFDRHRAFHANLLARSQTASLAH